MRLLSLFALPHAQALERQKEFFDSVRSERDDLREEVGVLKEEVKVGPVDRQEGKFRRRPRALGCSGACPPVGRRCFLSRRWLWLY